MIGSLFGDTIVYTKKILFINTEKTKTNVKHVDVEVIWGAKYLAFKNLSNGRISHIKCNKIIDWTDNDGNPINTECSSFIDELHKIENSLGEKAQGLGGALIGFGGLILAYQNNIDADKIPPNDSHKNLTTMGYGFIAIGGFLIAAGI